MQLIMEVGSDAVCEYNRLQLHYTCEWSKCAAGCILCLDRPGDRHRRACFPHCARRGDGQHCAAVVAERCMRGVVVYTSERAIGVLVATSDSTRVEYLQRPQTHITKLRLAKMTHRRESRCSPWAEVVPVQRSPALSASVDRTMQWVTHGRLIASRLLRFAYDTVRSDLIAANPSGRTCGRSVADTRDWPP